MNFNAVNYSYKDAQARSLPSPPPQTPVLSTNPLTTQCLLVSIQQLRRKKYKEKEIKPFTVKANRRTHISI